MTKSLQILVQEIKQLDNFWWIVRPINSSNLLSIGVEADFFDRNGRKISGKIVDHNAIDLSASVVCAAEISDDGAFLVDTYQPPPSHLVVEKIKSKTPSVPPRRISTNPPRR